MSKIEWTEETWNPLIGCSKVSPGCKNCYAIQTAWIRQHNPKMAERYAGVVEKTPGGNLNWTGKVNVANEVMDKPLRKKKPTMYFVNSMSDLFHEAVPFDVIDKIYAVMGRCQHHIFQILTKRPERMLEYYKSNPYQRILNAAYQLNLPKNHSLGSGIDNPSRANWGWQHVWVGASIENQPAAFERIPPLLQVPAAVHFLSCEPLLGPLDLMQDQLRRKDGSYPFPYLADKYRTKWLHNIDWVICGGESGPGARPLHPDWVRSLRDQCQKAGTAFFFKQWGEWKPFFEGDSRKPDYGTFKNNPGDWNEEPAGTFLPDVMGLDWGTVMTKVGKKAAGRLLDGREWNEFPVSGKRTAPADDPDLHAGGFDY